MYRSPVATFAELLKAAPSLSQSLSMAQLIRFIELCEQCSSQILEIVAKDLAERYLPSFPPLPAKISSIMTEELQLDLPLVELLWENVAPVVIFRGESSSGFHIAAPPTVICLRDQCKQENLTAPLSYKATLFTMSRGALVLQVRSLYCKRCKTRFFPNYYVREASDDDAVREFYPNIEHSMLEVHKHAFVDMDLCKFIENQYLFAHTSSENISKLYNRCIARPTGSFLPAGSALASDVVFDAFLLHALLRDSRLVGYTLKVPHNGNQNSRFDQALHDRNVQKSGTGQLQWSHACDDCMKIKTDPDGRKYKITACVIDGVTMGHPCCSFKDAQNLPCRLPLEQPQHVFCSKHAEQERLCAFRECPSPREAGFKTCTKEQHRTVEIAATQRGSSIFQLKERWFWAKELAAARTTSSEHKQPRKLRKKLKAVFKRTWTHNEQFAVRCCGVFVSRATFYQAEAVSGVKEFIMATFPEELPGSRPTYIFYDDNCKLWAHLAKLSKTSERIRLYFSKIGLPVDVFHFRSKHKTTDLICQTHCNPYSFSDLHQDNKWVFNSSAAEQANVWLGKYDNIVREMSQHRYNFFLDEMISLRNEYVVENLRKHGKRPHLVPEEDLRRPEYLQT